MLLVFSQKAGAGLFLHNLLHTPALATEKKAQGNDEQQGFNYTCNCADDFLLPFTAAEEVVYAVNISVSQVPFKFLSVPVPVSISILSFLRGPPVV